MVKVRNSLPYALKENQRRNKQAESLFFLRQPLHEHLKTATEELPWNG